MINIAGITICFIFIAFIINNKSLNRADYYLATINVLLASFLAFELLVANQFTPELVIIYQIISFLLFPFFFLYGIEMLRLSIRHKIVFFIPAFSLLLWFFVDFYVLHQRSAVYAEQIYRYPTFIYHVFYKGQLILTCIGEFWLLVQIKKYQQEIRDQYSFIEPHELKWLKIVTIVFLSLTILSLAAYLIYNFYDTYFEIESVTRLLNACLLLAVFYMSYHGIHLYVGTSRTKESKSPEPSIGEERKYIKSSMGDGQLQEVHQRLIKLFQVEKPYLEAQLQLLQVAQKLEVSTHILSQTINKVEKKSFYDFVNQYRIDHFKELLSHPANRKFSILALGMDSGFNSKASMNRIFKELTGQTPSSYQKIQQEHVSPAQ